MSFDDARIVHGQTWAVDPSWHQGPGAFGGLVAAVLLDEAQRHVDPGLVPRAIDVRLMEPASGTLRLSATTMRAGRAVVHVTSTLSRGDRPVAAATTMFAVPRPFVAPAPPATPPEVPRFSTTRPGSLGAEGAPAFTRHIDFRPCWGRGPFVASAPEQRFGGWVRPVEPAVPDSGLALLLLDAWPPGLFAAAPRPVPAATVCLSAHFIAPLGDDPAWIGTVLGRAAADGYASQDNEVWSADGRLLARAQQLFAMLAPFPGA